MIKRRPDRRRQPRIVRAAPAKNTADTLLTSVSPGESIRAADVASDDKAAVPVVNLIGLTADAEPNGVENRRSLNRRGMYALFSRYLSGAQGSLRHKKAARA